MSLQKTELDGELSLLQYDGQSGKRNSRCLEGIENRCMTLNLTAFCCYVIGVINFTHVSIVDVLDSI